MAGRSRAQGGGPNPTAQTQFLAPPARVSVVSGEVVLVTAHRAFGTNTEPDGAGQLDLNICFRRVGEAGLTPVGSEMSDLNLDYRQRVVFGLSQLISGLPTAQYDVGLCGDADRSPNWNYNSNGNTTALVFRIPRATATFRVAAAGPERSGSAVSCRPGRVEALQRSGSGKAAGA